LGRDDLAAEFADSIFQPSEHPAHPMFVLRTADCSTP
jgi:hypothetical protein